MVVWLVCQFILLPESKDPISQLLEFLHCVIHMFAHEILDGEVGNWVWGLGPFSTHDSDLS